MARWRCRSLHVLWVLWWLSRVGRILVQPYRMSLGRVLVSQGQFTFSVVVVSSIVLVALSMTSRFMGRFVCQGKFSAWRNGVVGLFTFFGCYGSQPFWTFLVLPSRMSLGKVLVSQGQFTLSLQQVWYWCKLFRIHWATSHAIGSQGEPSAACLDAVVLSSQCNP